MAGRGEYQKQLAALWAKAKADNLKLTDIVPEHMQEGFSQMHELHEAREMVKTLQHRETQLQAANATLIKDLDEKQAEIDDLPAEYQSAKIDLQQAQRQIANYKDTIDDLNDRIERYRSQVKGIVDIKQADAAATEKLENLQMDVQDQQTLINKLKEDNRKSVEMSEQLRKADIKALERTCNMLAKKDKDLAEKDKQLVKKDAELAEKTKELAQMEDFLVEVQKAHYTPEVSSVNNDEGAKTLANSSHDDLLTQNIDLLQQNLRLTEDNNALEEQRDQLKTQLSDILASQESLDRVFAAVVSETKTLFRFYKGSSQVIRSLTNFFAGDKADIKMLYNIEKQLDSVQETLKGYFEVKDVVRAAVEDINDTERLTLCKELDSLASTASDSASSLEMLHIVLWAFLNKLSQDPKMMSDLNGALCDEDRRRMRMIDLNSSD